MPFLNAAGVDVHYVEHGPAAGSAAYTAVLLHGFPPDHRIMTGCFEPVFADRRGWRRLYLDLPGMGRTVAPATVGSTDDVFAVVRAAVQQLVPDGRYAICGESYGGYLARGLVAADPARTTGLALVCPMVIAEHALRDVDEHVVLVRDAFAAALPAGTDFDQIAVVQTEETYARTQREVVVGLDLADPSALQRIGGSYAGTFPLETEAPPYPGPVLFFLGRQDSSTGYRDAWRILEHYPRATFAVLDRAGHNAQIEQPALFAALVHEWLDRIEEAG
ncbi:alpha/beta hydrolase [Actinoplanes sp. KI2]|uniref:alpha/beta fold hydrolase n=1 Tax=Actinoplanes sp. KI2 TaxID=2983315 RepID=UPI0021D5F8D4|nr:alpha/beta hydrolase [Actinoplanes sp. KI2]MCU7730473.1 alpha/beta hydrolase [Actinoplanes sp. KI2]